MKSFNRRQGFTFIELIIAVIIIGIIATSLAMAVPSAFVATRKTENISKATELASKYLETLKTNLSYPSQYDLATAGTNPPIALSSQYTGNGSYTVTTRITDLENENINGATVATLKEIDIIYKKSGESNILANLSTIIARPR